MRSLLLALFLILFIGSCADESGASLSQTSTFIRYFNGGADDIAQTIQETPDGGYIILANSEIEPPDAIAYSKIKLIKTDANGTQEWQKVFPAYGSDGSSTARISYAGYGLLILPNNAGYVVVGEDINNGVSQPLIMATDALGDNFRKITIPVTNPVTNQPIDVVGKAVTQNTNGNLLLLAQSDDTMILSEFALNPFSATPNWTRSYEGGQINNLVNKIFTNSAGAVYLGGTVERNNATSKIRFIKTTQNSDIVDTDPVIGNPSFSETGVDICRFGFGFAVIGTTNQKPNTSAPGDQDILFRRLSEDGSEIPEQTKSFQLFGSDGNDLLGSEEGNSIYATKDGGLILLGTVDSKVGTADAVDLRGNKGSGEKDMYLIKIDPFGGVAWTQLYGSKFIDTGASVIQSSDGGFVVLGTTDFSSALKTIVMLKTDKDGKIQ